MAVIKVYTRINWLNKSESLTTPLGKTNLNKMDKAIAVSYTHLRAHET